MFVSTVHIQLSLAFMSAYPPILLGTVSMVDSLILMVMALVVFGPRRLPQIGRQIGKLMYEFRKASNDFKFQMEEELRSAEEADRRKKEDERINALAVEATTPKLSAPEAMAPLLPSSTASALTDETILSTTAETAYPDDGVYPPQVAAPPEIPDDTAYPRIQPPSTGEQVPATRPNSLTALAKAANGDQPSPADPEPGSQNAAAVPETPLDQNDQNASEPEQATHHG
jgi:sec-independent protein translocase protein TatB